MKSWHDLGRAIDMNAPVEYVPRHWSVGPLMSYDRTPRYVPKHAEAEHYALIRFTGDAWSFAEVIHEMEFEYQWADVAAIAEGQIWTNSKRLAPYSEIVELFERLS